MQHKTFENEEPVLNTEKEEPILKTEKEKEVNTSEDTVRENPGRKWIGAKQQSMQHTLSKAFIQFLNYDIYWLTQNQQWQSALDIFAKKISFGFFSPINDVKEVPPEIQSLRDFKAKEGQDYFHELTIVASRISTGETKSTRRFCAKLADCRHIKRHEVKKIKEALFDLFYFIEGRKALINDETCKTRIEDYFKDNDDYHSAAYQEYRKDRMKEEALQQIQNTETRHIYNRK